MHKLLFCIAGCTALNIATGDASPGALVAALGAMLCCTSVATCDASTGALVAALVWQPVKHAVAFHTKAINK